MPTARDHNLPATAPGVCIWLTGRSGAGKSTVTAALLPMLAARGRVVTVLDTVPLLAKTAGERGSRGKLLRKAFVASEVVRHGGVVICVTVSARSSVRREASEIVGAESFFEIHFDLSKDIAEQRRLQRGSKRAFSKRLKGSVKSLLAVFGERHRSDYEAPENPAVTIDSSRQTPEEAADSIMAALIAAGHL
jgi:sulfate adenylyltransferase